jgi:hypothetical protein
MHFHGAFSFQAARGGQATLSPDGMVQSRRGKRSHGAFPDSFVFIDFLGSFCDLSSKPAFLGWIAKSVGFCRIASARQGNPAAKAEPTPAGHPILPGFVLRPFL